MGRLSGALVLATLVTAWGCASTADSDEPLYEEVRAEEVAEFMLHLNNRSETERHRNGLAAVGLRSPEDRTYVLTHLSEAYDESMKRGGSGPGVLRTPGRRRVMELVGLLPDDPQGRKLLKDGLKDIPEVKIPAAAALAAFGDDSALGLLIDATLGVRDKDARRAGLTALRKLALPRLREAFLAGLDERAGDVLGPIVLRTFPAAGAERSKSLQDVASRHKNPYARCLALLTLAAEGDPAAIDIARQTLSSNDPVVRPVALRVLGSKGGKEAAIEIERTLRQDPKDVGAVTMGLYEVGTEDALDRAIGIASDSELLPETRVGVVSGFLGRLRDSKAPRPYRRKAAHERAVAALRELLSDESSEVVSAAALALGRIGDRGKDVDPLLGLLQDPTPQVGLAVVEALGRLGGEDAGARLVDLIENAPNLRMAAAEAFAFLPRARDVPVGDVIDLLDDERIPVRKASIVALKRLSRSKDSLGFDPEGKAESRARGVARWRAWWKARRG
ncbi:MAG: HEAT repeat domain-containing protein [Planctomycetes bacterium]|nr:HEAT repeat domain-containing protein [Planctomycetota bacterium]